MTLQTAPTPGISMWVVEFGLTFVALALAFTLPARRRDWFSRIEASLGRFAQRRGLAVLSVGLMAMLLRLALLPLCPIPLPFIPDEFSFLFAGDTFASGRLANPTPMMWTHFETIHISMQPTCVSMYFPAQGLILAAGKLLFGHPWFGLLCFNALMCAAICWMLQAWLPSGWALLGGCLAILRLGLFSYWINSFNGGASIAALGGALVLGAFPRVLKSTRHSDCILLAIGIAILLLSRPYEGLLLCLPVAVVLIHWILKGKNRPAAILLLRRAALPLGLIAATGIWLGYYDYVAFGKPTTLPYTINRATYAVEPYWIWQQPRPEPIYRHSVMRDFYVKQELPIVTAYHTTHGFLVQNLMKPINMIRFFAGFALLPPLILLYKVCGDRRTRFLVLGTIVLAAGMFLEVVLLPQYIAPFTAAFYAIGLQCMRHLRFFKSGRQPAGLWMVRLLVLICIATACLRADAQQLHLELANWPPAEWTANWFGNGQLGANRANIEKTLERQPGKQLVIVRYSPQHNPVNEWVYNAADLENSKVIWAREMSAPENLKLMLFYSDRKVWLAQPDQSPVTAVPYGGANADAVHTP